MNRKPDVIRALVVVFAVGLLITGVTTFAASDRTTASVSSSAEYWAVPAGTNARIGSSY